MELPIILSLSRGRDDGGITENYRVYEGGGQVAVKNKRGETVQKNTLLGGNGTIYVANTLAATHEEFVLMPRAMYNELLRKAGGRPATEKKK